MYTRICCVVAFWIQLSDVDAAYADDTISSCYSDLCGLCIPYLKSIRENAVLKFMITINLIITAGSYTIEIHYIYIDYELWNR